MSGKVTEGTRPEPPSDNVKGILWALLATALFATVAALAKVAVIEYHVLQILFFRQIVVFVSTIPSLAQSFPQCLRTAHPGLHAVRLMGAFVALSFSIWAVAVLPLTTAITLGFAQTLFVSILAWLFLKEAVGVRRVIAVVAGFIGVVIVMRPGVSGLLDWYAIVPTLGALGAAFAIVSVRRLSATESTATLLIYQALFVGLLAGIPLLWFWVTPDIKGWLLLLSMGMLATVGQWVGVKSLRLGEASVVSNIEYMKLLYATVLGYLLFKEIPELSTLVGAGIIVGSALYVLQWERKASERPNSD